MIRFYLYKIMFITFVQIFIMYDITLNCANMVGNSFQYSQSLETISPWHLKVKTNIVDMLNKNVIMHNIFFNQIETQPLQTVSACALRVYTYMGILREGKSRK